MVKKVGIFGGSFNPPHVGHVLTAQYVSMVGGFDEMLIVPSYNHPFGKKHVSFYHRLKMCQLAFKNIPRAIVDPIESVIPSPSYMCDVLKVLHKARPANYKLVIGSDILLEIDRWKNYEEVMMLAPPYVVDRAGYSRPGLNVRLEMPKISSSYIREVLKFSTESVTSFLPTDVLEYIKENDLYKKDK